MDTIEFSRNLIASVHKQADDVMKDTSSEEFNWTPPGTANPISAVFVHLLTSEDYFVQRVIQGRQELWEENGWGEKLGVSNIPGFGGNWDEFKQKTLSLHPVLAYQKDVRAATDTYMDKLTPDELEHKMKFAGEERTIARIIIHFACHIACHAGEIAALKGFQGSKGLPY